jgi:signal transduction histidine kinase
VKWLPKPEDLVWVFLFVALAWTSIPEHPIEVPLLSILGLFQILEPRIPFFLSTPGKIWAVCLKLALCYLLIGYTGGINSSYYLILLLPVMSGASAFGAGGAMLVTLAASTVYLSFLLLLDWSKYLIEPDQQRELVLRLIVFGVVGYLSNRLAAQSREQSRSYKALAEQLAEANRSLQEAEAAVRRSERLAALGQLAAGLAHELRNPMGTMKASAEMLSRQLGPGGDVAREMAGFISSEVDRANQLITRFLEFARPLRLQVAVKELAAVIDGAIEQMQRTWEVVVFKNYSPEIAPFPMDAELMERVMYNLLLNAAQASPPGAEVTVKTRLAGGFAEISVIDRGAGIKPEHREAIFNPFFTTKPDGVGLGLAIVSKVVDEHGGNISVESEIGKGSVFRVYLPLVSATKRLETEVPVL